MRACARSQDDKVSGAEELAPEGEAGVVDNTPNIDKVVVDMPAPEVAGIRAYFFSLYPFDAADCTVLNAGRAWCK